MRDDNRLNVIIAAGPRDSSRAFLGLAMASAAAAEGVAVSVYFTMEGAQLVNTSNCAKVFVAGYPSVSEFIELITDAGGDAAYCPGCVAGECSPQLEPRLAVRDSCDLVSPAGMAVYARQLTTVPTVVF